jgi:Leucine-rich repeat (LRR) protein
LTEASLSTIDKLDLETFEATRPQLDGTELAKLHFLPKLQNLYLNGLKNITPVLKKIAGSKTLVVLDCSDCPLTTEDMVLIAQFPNLRDLNVSGNKLTAEDVRTLAKLPHLEKILALRTKIGGKNLLEELSRLKGLKLLQLSKDQITLSAKIWLARKCPLLDLQVLPEPY